MKITITTLLLFFAFSFQAQEKGSLMHYQKKCTECLALAGETFSSKNFFIVVSDSVYSGGQITVKQLNQTTFTAKKALLLFGSNSYSKTQFFIKGKKNIAAYEKWAATKIKADPNGNSSLRIVNETPIYYNAVRKGNKLFVNAETSI